MENAVQALKTAAAVLIFTIAITVAFTMFSRAKASADAIVRAQDSQEYLESADVAGRLYETTTSASTGSEPTITSEGYRIVEKDDVISTIYRYNLEKYGVTIIKSNGEVVARFDSNTENIMRQWYNIKENASTIRENIAKEIKKHLKNNRVTNIQLNDETLEKLYAIDIKGAATEGGQKIIKCGAPWYGNNADIIKRINADINGSKCHFVGDSIQYQGKNLNSQLTGSIFEIVNEIDNSKYLKEEGQDTNLLQQYELPTIEVIYIIQ